MLPRFFSRTTALASMLALACCFAMATQVAGDETTSGPRTYLLKPDQSAIPLQQVTQTLKVAGTLEVPTTGAPQTQKLGVSATFDFLEKPLAAELASGKIRTVRQYREAKADISVGDDKLSQQLPNAKRLVAVDVQLPRVHLYCPNDHLTRPELDLIDIPAPSPVLPTILPEQEKAIGESWTVQDSAMCALLRLDTVIVNTVQAQLTEVDGNVAKIELNGSVEGGVDGVSTKIDIKARLHFDLGRKCVSWFGMAMREKRDTGPVSPGLEVVAQTAITIKPGGSDSQIPALAEEALKPTPERLLLCHENRAYGWRLYYDRAWHLTADDGQLAVFRLVDKGVYLGQCKIAVSQPGEPITLKRLQQDVQQALGENFGGFVSASEGQLEGVGELIKLTATGQVAEVPVQWHYYVINNSSGKTALFAFVCEESLADKFTSHCKPMVAGFQFLPEQIALH